MIKLFKNEQQIIKEIHDSFDNAENILLEQAYSIINSVSEDFADKAERLEKLGFINSKTVTEIHEKRKALLSSKKDAELVNYYKSTYPFLKFLKEEQLDEICNRYQLIYAPVSNYKEDVPEKNIKEIENAQPLKSEDKRKDIYFLQVHKPWYTVPSDLKSILKKGFYVDQYCSPNDRSVLRYARSHGGYKGNYSHWTVSSSENSATITEISYNELFIAAPKSHFELKELKKDKKGFFKFTVTEIKDPIVFRYVRGGIQVLSKWGLESSDRDLQVEILN